jgi:hypothetical protein
VGVFDLTQHPWNCTLRHLTTFAALLSGIGLASAAFAPRAGLVATTLNDFVQPGTQPFGVVDQILDSGICSGCHGDYNDNVEPYRIWASSMMAQSSRDPIFHAALAIANQDATDSGELCLRCHTPGAWIAGRSTPTDGSALDTSLGDLDGVTCHLCHRMVDPFSAPGDPINGSGPAIGSDAAILAGLPNPVVHEPHNGQYIIDPLDNRRGPFQLSSGFFFHNWAQSSYHRESLLCANCHDVSNPALSRQPDGSYQLNALDTPHPTANKLDEFPIERTFSEWKHSVFAQTEIDTGGLFGGDKPTVATCQDCHMPDTLGAAAFPGLGAATRPDQPLHQFNGANSWVLRAVDALYPQTETALTDQNIDDAIARNEAMLANAAALSAFERNGELLVRVRNRSGHKLPTGYGEGRRMWINVQFYSGATMIAERGQYDGATADLTTNDTTVYEIVQGLDATQAAASGLPAGESFHFVLNNTILKDNRIPPRGFVESAFEGVQAAPIAYTYMDQHHWDDVTYAIPAGATSATVNLYHQTTSKEYIEFLRDENTTNNAGLDAWTLWDMFGKSAPVLMQTSDVDLTVIECAEPFAYGLGTPNSAGGYAWIGYSGSPSVAASNLEVTLDGALPGTFAALFESSASANLPLWGGTLLVSMPSHGRVFLTDGSGGYSQAIALNPGMIGVQRYYQFLYRDRAAPSSVGFSDGLHVEFCP